MATLSVGKKALLLGLLVAAFAATTVSGSKGPPATPSFTIDNPTKMAVNVLVGDVTFKMATDVMTINLNLPEEDVKIQTSEGQVTELHVRDGDVLLLQPNSENPRNFLVLMGNAGKPIGEPKPPMFAP